MVIKKAISLLGLGKKTTVYRGQTADKNKNLRGGDWARKHQNNPELNKYSNRFWTQRKELAQKYAKDASNIAGKDYPQNWKDPVNPPVVLKATVPKTEALRGYKGIIEYQKDSRSVPNYATDSYDGRHNPKDINRYKIGMAKENIRKNNLYQTILDPKKKRLAVRATFEVNPTFKGARVRLLKSVGSTALKVGSRLFAPVALIDFFANPIPAYDPRHGYKGKEIDPRKRMKQTIKSINR